MFLIVGLGNPGKNYAGHRHNVGFMAIDFMAHRLNLPVFKNAGKFKAEISLGRIAGQPVILAKPQTYMNNSGSAVSLLKRYYKIQPDNILIIHDDLDISFGKMKLKFGGSSAGHNGLKSIMESLGTDGFWRLRLGLANKTLAKIMRQPQPAKRASVSRFVLSRFSLFERYQLKQRILPTAFEQLLDFVQHNHR